MSYLCLANWTGSLIIDSSLAHYHYCLSQVNCFFLSYLHFTSWTWFLLPVFGFITWSLSLYCLRWIVFFFCDIFVWLTKLYPYCMYLDLSLDHYCYSTCQVNWFFFCGIFISLSPILLLVLGFICHCYSTCLSGELNIFFFIQSLTYFLHLEVLMALIPTILLENTQSVSFTLVVIFFITIKTV